MGQAERDLKLRLDREWAQFNSAKSQVEAQAKMRQALETYRTLKKQVQITKEIGK